MAKRKGRKYWKAEAKRLDRVADELLTQLQQRAGELAEIDLMLSNAEMPGPTLPEWAEQLSTFFLELAHKRGVTPRPFPGAKLHVPLSQGSGRGSSTPPPYEAPDNGEHELITVDHVTARS